ncbi:DNA replication regulator SLD3-domain-containing protein [Lipomyces japonicus]|uniref:DNA replication regulator SLD3-domain-containing protein n=1 Tax=Lipomyces japonicus TaxID=56871 RepID=UPI0034CE9A08
MVDETDDPCLPKDNSPYQESTTQGRQGLQVDVESQRAFADNISGAVASPTSLRKRKNAELVPQYMQPFTIHPFISSITSLPINVTPIKAIPRDQIPISIIAHVSHVLLPSSSISKQRKARTTISQLQEGRVFCMKMPELGDLILFVKVEEEKVLAAIELIESDVFMISPLPENIKAKHIRSLWKKIKILNVQGQLMEQSLAFSLLETDFDLFWKSKTKVQSISSMDSQGYDPEVVNAFSNFSMAPPSLADPTVPSKLQAPVDEAPVTMALPVLAKGNSIKQLLKHMQALYYEALYISKSPLTFFCKNTLSRFRVSCNQDAKKIGHVLRDMMLTVGETDYKYKIGLHNTLAELESLHGQDKAGMGLDNPDDPTNNVPVSLNIQQSLVGLSSLDHEKQYITKWWNSDEDVRKMKHRINKVNHLKKRETTLQIILALEIISQESSIKQAETLEGSKPKKKKIDHGAVNFDLLLDVLFDRLYIWQAVSTLDLLNLEEKTDEVREFCLEIVIPFYGSRLPKQTDQILRKCGGKPRTGTAMRTQSTGALQSFSFEQEQIEDTLPTDLGSSPVINKPKPIRPTVKSRSVSGPVVSKARLNFAAATSRKVAPRSNFRGASALEKRQFDMASKLK